MEFLNNVTGGNGLVTLSTNKSNSFVVDLTHQHSWFEIQDRPDTFATYGLSAELSTILGNLKSMIIQGDGNTIGTYTPTSALTVNFVSGTNISISRDSTNHTLTIANTYSHPTGGANTTISNANGRVLSSITVNSLGHVTSVGYKTLAMADMPAAMMYYNSISSSNGALTFSGYNISDTVVDLTHQHSWFEIQDRPTTIAGYGITDAKIQNGVITLGSNTITVQNNLTTSTSTTSYSLSAYQGYLLANGSARDSTKLPLAGNTTMTGHFSLYGGQYNYTTNSNSYGLDCNNSDIIGINGLFTNDYSEGWTEGINFARSSSGWDSIYAQDGTWYFKANNGTAYATVYCGALYSAGAVTALSDARHKKIASTVNLNIEQVAQMPDIRFTWNDRDDDKLHVGTIAQDWQRILPEVVTEANDVDRTLSMDYGVAALVSAITTARKVVDHEKRIKELEKECERLRTENEILMSKVA